VADSWGSVLTELVPLALVITLSPLSVIPAVLVLHTPRPRPTSLAFLAGWVLGLTALTAAFVELSDLVGGDLVGGGRNSPPPWASWLRIVVGAALIAFGVWRWLTRHRSEHSPAWLRAMSNITPARAGGAGALLAVVNPKVLFICLATGLAISTAGLGTGAAWAALVVFVLVAASSVAVPVLGYAAAGDRLDGPLARLKDWLERHNAPLVAVILVVIGLLVLYKGIHGLA
jgi:threonine/homoserine/homoserine lactone efflux protein